MVGIVKKSSGFAIKYSTVGLPTPDKIPNFEKTLDRTIEEILKDLTRFKDAESFIAQVERKVTDTCLYEIGKEPKVVVVVQ